MHRLNLIKYVAYSFHRLNYDLFLKSLAETKEEDTFAELSDDEDGRQEDVGDTFTFTPHRGSISTLYIPLEDPNRMFSAAADGTIRYMDIEDQRFVEYFSSSRLVRSQWIFSVSVRFLLYTFL